MAQCVVSDQFPVEFGAVPFTQYLVTAPVPVTLETFPQLPIEDPVKGAAPPAPVMSKKSAFESETAAAVIVRDVPEVSENTSTLFIVEFPVTFKVPFTV